MSIYGRRKNNLFLGYFTDLTELQTAYPIGEDGQFAGVNDVKKKYYWDITSRSWEDSGDNPATEDTLQKVLGFQIPVYDYISLGYTGSNLTTVVYKTGGSGGTTVATLTLGYSGSTLTSVTKT